MTSDYDPLWIYEDQSPTAVRSERRAALGLVIEWSAIMEEILRTSFCSLVGSKYAAVVAGGQGAEWLLENCKAVAKVHREISDDEKAAIITAIDRCSAANQRRNTLVHGIKAAGRATDSSFHTLRSRRGRHVHLREPWTVAETAEAAAALRKASASLAVAVEDALPEMAAMSIELELLEEVERNSGSSE
jgi:hypothetical protein